MVVAGGWDIAETCPFAYTRADDYDTLRKRLSGFDAVLYHWLPDWAVRAVRDSGVACVEFVHRTDTSECDKRVPHELLTHSHYLAEFLFKNMAAAAWSPSMRSTPSALCPSPGWATTWAA